MRALGMFAMWLVDVAAPHRPVSPRELAEAQPVTAMHSISMRALSARPVAPNALRAGK